MPAESWSFDGAAYPEAQDFDWRDYFRPNNPAGGTNPEQIETTWATETAISSPATNQIMSQALNWLWNRAADEWIDLAEDLDTDGDES